MSYKDNYGHMLDQKRGEADMQIHIDTIVEHLTIFHQELADFGGLQSSFLKNAHIIASCYLDLRKQDRSFIYSSDPITQYIRDGLYAISEVWFTARTDAGDSMDSDFQHADAIAVTKALLQFFKDSKDAVDQNDFRLYLQRLRIEADFTAEESEEINRI